MGSTSTKGNLGVAKVLADVVGRGFRVALPLGDDAPFDLIVIRENSKLERVQCKYTQSNGKFIVVRCASHSAWVNYKYTADLIDWLAVYDQTTNRCYYVPATLLGAGKQMLHLRLVPGANNQRQGVRLASDFVDL
jgi:hypothetical protein